MTRDYTADPLRINDLDSVTHRLITHGGRLSRKRVDKARRQLERYVRDDRIYFPKIRHVALIVVLAAVPVGLAAGLLTRLIFPRSVLFVLSLNFGLGLATLRVAIRLGERWSIARQRRTHTRRSA